MAGGPSVGAGAVPSSFGDGVQAAAATAATTASVHGQRALIGPPRAVQRGGRLANRLDDGGALRLGEARAAGQAQAARGRSSAPTAPPRITQSAEHRLQVHRLPGRPGLDVVRAPGAEDSVAVAPNAAASTSRQVSQQLGSP